jgi:hypothetical protein
LISPDLNRTGANEAGFCRHCVKKLLEIRTNPSSVPVRKSWRRREERRDASDYERVPNITINAKVS